MNPVNSPPSRPPGLPEKNNFLCGWDQRGRLGNEATQQDSKPQIALSKIPYWVTQLQDSKLQIALSKIPVLGDSVAGL
jgi:hypothetical protein